MSLPILQKHHKKPYPAISPTRPELSQAGKTVLVMGSNAGIGLAIARSFVTSGAKKVIVTGRRAEATESAAAMLNKEAADGTLVAQAKVMDSLDVQQVQQLWKDLEQQGVYVDVLVASVCSYGGKESIMDMSIEETWREYEANVHAPLAMVHHFAHQPNGSGQKVRTHTSTMNISTFTLCGSLREY